MEKINSTTYKKDNKDKFNRFEIEVGDIHSEDFKPQVKLKRWDNECNASFRVIDDGLDEPTIKEEEGKIKYIKNKIEAHFYEVEKGHEFEVVLKKKPNINKIQMSIETKRLKFYYQPPLTEEIKVGDEGGRIVKVTETDAYVKDEKTGELTSVNHRPENVVGSYAVYHKSNSGDYSKMGGKNYMAGKAFHIYRPKIIDSNGNWVWGNLSIDEKSGILTIEIDQDFLDNAVYPVNVDPTFGYDTVGGSTQNVGNYQVSGSYHTITETGTADSMTGYFDIAGGYSSGDEFKTGIYQGTSLIGSSAAVDLQNADPAWRTANMNGESLTANTEYMLVAMSNVMPLRCCYLYYDSGTEGDSNYDNQDDFIFDDPANWEDRDTDRKYSIYCTYTAGGGTKVIKPTYQLGKGMQINSKNHHLS